MISVTRERPLAYGPDAVWAVLSDPANLPKIMDRITRVEVGAVTGGSRPLTAHFDFGTQIGQRSAPGVFRTVGRDEVLFESAKPLPLLARWTLQPAGETVVLTALLRFDLKAMLGPLAMLAPSAMIKARVGAELETALKRTEQLLRSGSATKNDLA